MVHEVAIPIVDVTIATGLGVSNCWGDHFVVVFFIWSFPIVYSLARRGRGRRRNGSSPHPSQVHRELCRKLSLPELDQV